MHFLVFQHADVEHPGAFRDHWRAAGVTWTTIDLGGGQLPPSDLSAFDALVVMGGPQDVWQTDRYPWLMPEMDAIRRWVHDVRRPYLGVCLGHQLLAQALGGHVALAAQSEVGPHAVTLTAGAARDPLLRGLGTPLGVFQWHSAEVQRAPAGAVALAASPLCAVQAMRVGVHAWGVQFHGELSADTVPEWTGIPEYRASLQQRFGADGYDRLLAETNAKLPDYQRLARTLSDNWLAVVRTARD